MARKAKTATKNVAAKKPLKKAAKKKVGVKKFAKKQSSTVRAVKKTARAFVKSARRKTTASKKAGKGLVRRAVEAIAQVAAPLMPGSEPGKPKVE